MELPGTIMDEIIDASKQQPVYPENKFLNIDLPWIYDCALEIRNYYYDIYIKQCKRVSYFNSFVARLKTLDDRLEKIKQYVQVERYVLQQYNGYKNDCPCKLVDKYMRYSKKVENIIFQFEDKYKDVFVTDFCTT